MSKALGQHLDEIIHLIYDYQVKTGSDKFDYIEKDNIGLDIANNFSELMTRHGPEFMQLIEAAKEIDAEAKESAIHYKELSKQKYFIWLSNKIASLSEDAKTGERELNRLNHPDGKASPKTIELTGRLAKIKSEKRRLEYEKESLEPKIQASRPRVIF